MPTSLVQRARQVVSSEVDDFFLDETILYYLNKSLERVTSYLINTELRLNNEASDGIDKTLRNLDSLRRKSELALAGFSSATYGFKGTVNFPADLKKELYVQYKDVPVREISSHKKHFLGWGQLNPSGKEGYFYIMNDGSNRQFEVYLHENPDSTLTVYYIKTPGVIAMADEVLPDLPSTAENAVIYGAGVMMLGQESIRNSDENPAVIQRIYQEELQNIVY